MFTYNFSLKSSHFTWKVYLGSFGGSLAMAPESEESRKPRKTPITQCPTIQWTTAEASRAAGLSSCYFPCAASLRSQERLVTLWAHERSPEDGLRQCFDETGLLQVLLKGKGWEDRCQLIGWFWAPAFTRGSLPAPPGILWEEGERKTRAWNSTWRLLHSNPVLIKGPGKPGRCDPGFKAHLCSKSVSDAN